MNLKKLFTKKGILFLISFILLTYIGIHINFSGILGAENQFFTFFQFLGPIAGGFLGAGLGVIAVLGSQLLNFFLVGKEFEIVNLIRLTPMLFAAYYFAKNKERMLNDKIGILIPFIAAALFLLHPVGAEVWYLTLFFMVPVVIKFLPDRLFLRSLGATFTAYTIGTSLWIWTVPMTAEVWMALIPIVIFERTIFALGISGTYIALNTILSKVESLNITNLKALTIEDNYVLGKMKLLS